MTPMISEAARNQSGGFAKQDPQELKKQKEERIAEAKRRRREKKRMEMKEFKEEMAAITDRSISSEEFFDSKDEMAAQYR